MTNQSFEEWMDEYIDSLDEEKMLSKFNKMLGIADGNITTMGILAYGQGLKEGARAAHARDQELIKELVEAIREEYEDYYRWLDEGDIHVTSEYTDCIANLGKALTKARAYLGCEDD